MKRIALITCALVSCTFLFGQNTVKKDYRLESFNSIDASFIYEIEVFKGRDHTVKLEVPEELVDHIQVYVSKNTLYLGVTKEWWRTAKHVLGDRQKIKAAVIMNDLEGFQLSNSASLVTKEGFSPANFMAKLTGASKAEISIITHAANLDISGASELEISGLATKTKAYVSGASIMRYNQETDQIELKASGASTVVMNGSSTSASLTVSGASHLKALDFETKETDIKCSGASSAKVHVTKEIGVSATGASAVHIKGNPKFTRSVSSGASSINTY
ncbi:MAG TPA: DUF2807 domain-containing protein [Bacteroidales bacterium]|jgi:hypothetical protein|nr:DUF2807 domain-containing protein [Bacteroidales bacterium]OQC57822.1 MAG: hypothetical protein BWX52_00671 [Bacteroidetes bacterium ADurb.Bin013]MBP8999411.1 DUF2807 domain-containing protein [Bacteroidales bacterium]MBV6455695.1 hypothetical protein [Bacteroidales bacterium]MCZ2316782.1 DUF2807 domain-containing protein [Bacteroidales bacterium]